MAAKVQIKNDSVENFRWFCLFLNRFRRSMLDEILSNTIGVKGVVALCPYSNFLSSSMAVYASGVEDSARLSRDFTEEIHKSTTEKEPRTRKCVREFPPLRLPEASPGCHC